MASRQGNSIPRLWTGLKKRVKKMNGGNDPSLLTESQFKRQLFRERARADRSDSSLLVLTVSLQANGSGRRKLERLTDMLSGVVCKRVRMMDIVGLYGGKIGIILPDTPRNAAQALVNDIERTFHKRIRQQMPSEPDLPEILCHVYHFSSEPCNVESIGR
jgi:hypothetical protein